MTADDPRYRGQTIHQWAERAEISERNLGECQDALAKLQHEYEQAANVAQIYFWLLNNRNRT